MTRNKHSVFNMMIEDLLGRWRALACASMLLASASCVPGMAATAPSAAIAPGIFAAAVTTPPRPDQPVPVPEPMVLQDVSPLDALAINASIPVSAEANPGAPSVVFRAASPVDQLRSLQCLAEAVYYEARSETEDGQRAVAQVVLNRVRHPAFPSSVCGVVYQGPQRAGGGCQFTFTCDGSLAVRAAGPAWDQARRIAAAALAGSVYAPVGDATHYHTQQVVPSWAFRLVKSAVIGAHNFYRLNGAWGAPDAFRQRYSGRETSPALLIATRLPSSIARVPGLRPAIDTAAFAAAAPGAAGAPASAPVNDRLPVSQVREEYRSSGQWLDQPGGTPVR